MDYRKKITSFRYSGTTFFADQNGLDEACESNRGRILNSAALRRLQQKTQVFPLETNAAVRSRLTHSLEVMQTGRYIARSILKALRPNAKELGLENLENAFVSTVEMACLLHDVGNPPFGHFGEEAIGQWMQTHASTLLEKANPQVAGKWPQVILDDLTIYEGNAQAIRIVKTLQRLNLTLSQVASILKYTRGAWQTAPEPLTDPLYQLRKKPGYFLSEKPYIDAMHKHLGQGDGHRFPLVYIMEAADDISYCIADIDDAINKDLISVADLVGYLRQQLGLSQNVPHACKAHFLTTIEDKINSKDFNFGVHFRTPLVNALVKGACQCYLDNHQAIYTGVFSRSLVEGGGDFDQILAALKQIARHYVFTRKEVETLELKGMAAIGGLLDCHRGLMAMAHDDFQKIMTGTYIKGYGLEARLVRRLPDKFKQAYLRHIQQIDHSLTPSEQNLWAWYYRIRLVLDHISGMTDIFALEEYQTINAIN